MQFWEAMKLLQAGEKVRAVGWYREAYIYLNDVGNIVDEQEEIYEIYNLFGLEEWEVYTERKLCPKILKDVWSNIISPNSSLEEMLDNEDLARIRVLMVQLNEKYRIY